MKRVIIADASCLIALENIQQLSLLKAIFGEITIAETVLKEYGKETPSWMNVRSPQPSTQHLELQAILDSGETASIALALELDNTLLIIDEKKGRKVALTYGINIIGTLRLLLFAKEQNIIEEIKPLIESIKEAGFRISNKVENQLLKIANE